MKSLLIRPAAAADLEEAWLWYEDQRSGLGNEFLEEAEGLDPSTADRHLYRQARDMVSQAFGVAEGKTP